MEGEEEEEEEEEEEKPTGHDWTELAQDLVYLGCTTGCPRQGLLRQDDTGMGLDRTG